MSTDDGQRCSNAWLLPAADAIFPKQQAQTALPPVSPVPGRTKRHKQGLKHTLLTAAPACTSPALGQASRVDVAGVAYAVDAPGAVRCLPSDDGYGLVELDDGGTKVSVLGATGALTNGAIATDDDAAFALALLGGSSELTWYLPSAGDLPERDRWDAYTAAYEEALARTSTAHAPWYVVPADKKYVRDLFVAQIVVDALEQMDPKYPGPPEGLEQFRQALQ